MSSDLDSKGQRNVALENQMLGMYAGDEVPHLKGALNGSGEQSIEADVIERLMILATSIAINSREQSLIHNFTALLKSLIDAIEDISLTPLATVPHQAFAMVGMKKNGKAPHVLTPRQREVLRLRSMGLGAVEIAERLNLTPQTVHSHIRDAIERLGVSGGAMAAIAKARMLGLV